jgi:hypothetical protein
MGIPGQLAGAAERHITVAIICGTLYADGRYISAAGIFRWNQKPGSDGQATGIKAFEAVPWPVLANSGAS